ncbi:hypothetical protein BTS2_3923 [Bacillus sp. TS-2]|nr:hypothetical protein BTS2_3923 [Bacillus sp. TS-2]
MTNKEAGEVMEDEVLVTHILEGDDQALRVLYDRYFQSVFQYAYIQTGDYHFAEEVTQDIFSKMAKSLHTFKGKSAFKTWLYTLGRNVVIDFHRKQKRHKGVVSLPSEKMEEVSNNYNPQQNYEIREELIRCLNTLPEDYRTVIVLRFIEQFSIQETAKVMKKTALSVKSLQHRARKQLAQLMEGEGNSYES